MFFVLMRQTHSLPRSIDGLHKAIDKCFHMPPSMLDSEDRTQIIKHRGHVHALESLFGNNSINEQKQDVTRTSRMNAPYRQV